jgi:hypothetical protein
MEISVLKERKHQEIHHGVLVCECHLATADLQTESVPDQSSNQLCVGQHPSWISVIRTNIPLL